MCKEAYGKGNIWKFSAIIVFILIPHSLLSVRMAMEETFFEKNMYWPILKAKKCRGTIFEFLHCLSERAN